MLNKDKAKQMYSLAEKTAATIEMAEKDPKTFILATSDMSEAALKLAAMLGQLKEIKKQDAAA